MIKSRVSFLTAGIFVLAVAAIGAQDGLFMKAAWADQVGVIALDPINMGRTVKDAPYTAEAVTEVTQALPDGNRIEQRVSANVARDGRGRIRREQQGVAVGSFVAQNERPIVTITDPTTGEHIMLNYQRKVAFRSKPVRMKFEDKNGEQVTFAYGATMSATSTGGPNGPPPPADVTFETRVFEGARMARMRGHIAGAPFEGEPRTEKMEPRLIEGLKAEGTKTTVTIAAGAVGNALPIEIVSEQWYSPELQVVLMTRRSDPRFGETIYRLTNIVRSEPAPDLFKVPSDFKVQNMSAGRPMPVKPEDQ